MRAVRDADHGVALAGAVVMIGVLSLTLCRRRWRPRLIPTLLAILAVELVTIRWLLWQ